MHVTIGAKIFGIAVGLLLLMGAVAWLSTRLTQTVACQSTAPKLSWTRRPDQAGGTVKVRR